MTAAEKEFKPQTNDKNEACNNSPLTSSTLDVREYVCILCHSFFCGFLQVMLTTVVFSFSLGCSFEFPHSPHWVISIHFFPPTISCPSNLTHGLYFSWMELSTLLLRSQHNVMKAYCRYKMCIFHLSDYRVLVFWCCFFKNKKLLVKLNIEKAHLLSVHCSDDPHTVGIVLILNWVVGRRYDPSGSS